MKWLIRAFFLLMMLVLLAVAGAYQYFKTLLLPTRPGAKEKVVFEVRQGMSGSQVAQALAEQGVIGDEFAFRMLLRFHPRGKDLRVGVFELSAADSPMDVFEDLLVARPLSRRATFPEGLIIPQIAAIAHKSQLISNEAEFRRLATKEGKSFGEIFPPNLEGYLLPDTYEFPYRSDERAVLERLTGEFRGRVLPLWEKHKGHAPLKDLGQLVVLASLVEREAQVDRERPLIAGVYVNRLRLGMRLECDATVQYALGKTKPLLTFDDLKVESPYNTYRVEGLPPGPIANPGLKSLEAAMSPTPSKFLYYVRNDVAGDGSHVFGKNYQEHLANCNRYQR